MHYPLIEPLEPRIAPASLSIADVKITEGNVPSTTVDANGQVVANSAAKFLTVTATLDAPATSNVTFSLATKNGTAVAGADYVDKTETKTIAIGQSSATFTVTINGDSAFEATESFFVNLTGAPAGVTVVNSNPVDPGVQATARVYLYNDDTQTLGSNQAQWIDVDGDLVTLTVSKGGKFLTNANLLTLVPTGAVGGFQLQRLDLQAFGSIFAGASVSIIATKQAGFPDASNGTVDVGFIKGTTFNSDELRAVGIDLGNVTVDGDLAKITAGDSFATPAIAKLDLGSLGARGTATLASTDFDPPTTAVPAGFVVESKVLGPLTSMVVKNDVKSFLRVIGAEFGVLSSLKIGGTLQGGTTVLSGAISVSGRLGAATIGNIAGGAGNSSGWLAASSLGNGSLGSITVTGNITGGSGDDSGQIQGPRIGNVKAGKIVGGDGVQSGYIFSSTSIGNVTLTGDLVGGSDTDSGEIAAQTGIGAVKIGGKIVGAGGANSGSIRTGGGIVSLAVTGTQVGAALVGGTLEGGAGTGSGSIQTNRSIGAVSFLGKNAAGDSIKGGSGEDSGALKIGTNLTSFTAAGDVQGGTGNGSGAIVSTNGNIGTLVITGRLTGGNSGTTALDKTGYISAGRLGSATIGGITAGTAGTGSLTNSGAIRADVIGSLTVNGTVTGTAANPVVISASGLSSDLAITSVKITGNVAFAEILAGYNSTTSATNLRGIAVSADASIGTVTFGGTVAGLNIVAGGIAGTDGRFGTDDNQLANGTYTVGGVVKAVTDVPSVISKIASVVFLSQNAIATNTAAFGIVAQYVAAVKVGAVVAPLQTGPGNDVAAGATDPAPGIELKTGSKFRVVELLLPA